AVVVSVGVHDAGSVRRTVDIVGAAFETAVAAFELRQAHLVQLRVALARLRALSANTEGLRVASARDEGGEDAVTKGAAHMRLVTARNKSCQRPSCRGSHTAT